MYKVLIVLIFGIIVKSYFNEVSLLEKSTDLENRIQKITKYIYHEIDARHTIRVDFIVKKEKIYVLEINTLPGLSEKSSLSLMLAKENISVDKYIEKLIKK